MPDSIFVALDFESAEEALSLVAALGDDCSAYKVGLQTLVEAGPDMVRQLTSRGKSVFLDLKTHEIPNSVAGAVRAAGKLGADMVTVHASGGAAVLRSAVEAAAPFPRLKVLALTVITSLGDADLPEIGLQADVKAQVLRLARLAASCGCHGVVASPHEAAMLAEALPQGMLIVVPGIQLDATPGGDQARSASPGYAKAAGATHIVVGRAVTQAADPRLAYRRVVEAFQRQKITRSRG